MHSRTRAPELHTLCSVKGFPWYWTTLMSSVRQTLPMSIQCMPPYRWATLSIWGNSLLFFKKVRLVQQLDKPGWRNMRDVLDLLPGPSFEDTQQVAADSRPRSQGGPKVPRWTFQFWKYKLHFFQGGHGDVYWWLHHGRSCCTQVPLTTGEIFWQVFGSSFGFVIE